MDKIGFIINARFGDGHIQLNKNKTSKPCLSFSTINKDLAEYKALHLDANVTTRVQKDKILYRVHKSLNYHPYMDLEKEHLIEKIGYFDFLLWCLDDGNLNKNQFKLSSHNLSRSENIILSFKLWNSFALDSKLGYLRNKNSDRYLWYLRFNVEPFNSFKDDLECFIRENNILSMLYKIGRTE